MITEAVLAHEIAAAGFGPMTEASIRRLVLRVTADATVAEADVAAYYRRNVDLNRRPETRRVRHVLVESEAAACDIVRRLENGVQMDALARSESLDPGSRENGGDLGEIGREQFAGPFGDALFAAPIGELVGPIRTAHGWHVAVVQSIRASSVVPYDEARPAIEAELLAAERSRAFAQWLDERRTAIADIEPQFTHPGDPAIGVPVHRH